MNIKERNQTVDILRGVAILLVVLGHTIGGCVEHYANTTVYNVIWTLQMPLFFLLSGYVNKYSKTVCNWRTLWSMLLKKTAAYLVPWLVWTFCVRGLMFGHTTFFNLRYLFWHMDTGYWFLISLWMIVILFGVSQFAASKIIGADIKNHKQILLTLLCFALAAVALLAVGFAFGFSFLGIKLTVYYVPFYALGTLFAWVEESSEQNIRARATDVVVAISGLVFIALIMHFDFFSAGDSADIWEAILSVGLRFLASLCGCVALCGLLGKAVSECRPRWAYLTWVGRHSLEIYLIHYLVLCMVPMRQNPPAQSWEGVLLCAVNFVLTIALSSFLAWMLHQNRWLRKMLFWK